MHDGTQLTAPGADIVAEDGLGWVFLSQTGQDDSEQGASRAPL